MRISLLSLLLLACGGRPPTVPEGTPSCDETCNVAWLCGGVLQNDLPTCLATCSDESDNDADYRICVNETSCEAMADCKIYAPE